MPFSRALPSSAALALVTVLAGCGGAEAATQPPALTAYSGGSASGSFGSGSASAPRVDDVHFGSAAGQNGVGISVRPDSVEVPFAISATGATPLEAVRAEIAKLGTRIGEDAGRAPKVQLKSLDIGKTPSGKAAKDDNEHKATAQGCLVFAIAPEEDYWARAKLLDAIVRASERFTAAAKDDKTDKEKPRISSSIGAPLLTVKDAESHRGALTKKIVERARTLALEVDPHGTLSLDDCAMPQPVQQAVVGPEEIVLSLPITCKVQTRTQSK